MSRYKKVVMNEFELKEIDGVKALLKPTIEDRFDAVQIYKDFAVKKDIDLTKVRKWLVDLLCKSTPEEDRTDIETYVVTNIMELWTEAASALNIIDVEKAKKIAEEQKKELEEKN